MQLKEVHLTVEETVLKDLWWGAARRQLTTLFCIDGEQEFVNLDDKISKLAKFSPHLWRDDVSERLFV